MVPSLSSDAASFKVLAQELRDALEGNAPAEDLIQYVDVTEWQHDLLEGIEDAAMAAKTFWKGQAHTPLLLPLESVPENQSGETVRVPRPSD